MERRRTDILVLGAGGAGLPAALHAKDAAPDLEVTIAVKGLLGKCGCTRMVQGGYNVAIAAGDSAERHFMDTLDGGKWLNDQDLAWTLVVGAQQRIRELENRWGCFFDRNPDGTIHQKAFAGQTFDRTVHKGDLTGIEIVNRLMEQVWARPGIRRLEEHRAVALIPSRDGASISGVLLIDPGIRDAELVCLASDLQELGQPVVAGFATHPDWDHVLWHAEFGEAPRYGTARCAAVMRDLLSDPGWKAEMESIGEYLDSYGERTPHALKAERAKIAAQLA